MVFTQQNQTGQEEKIATPPILNLERHGGLHARNQV